MLVDQYDVFLLDLDGVIYVGNQALPGSGECIAALRNLGKQIYFLTNDPRPTRQELCDRLLAMGIQVKQEECITTGWTAANYLVKNHLTRVYVIGTQGLRSELADQGITVIGQGDCQAVVIGYDDAATFDNIQQAVSHIGKGAKFIATNADKSYPGPDGRCAATGAIVEAVQAASGQRPVVIGKPYPAMFEIVMQGIDGARTVMIGDTPETDILGARRQGIDAILVAKEECRFPSDRDCRIPDVIIPRLSALFDAEFTLRRRPKPDFSWPDSVQPGVTAVILNQYGQVLLVQREDNGLWGLPSGHVEISETVTEAIKREVKEETGLAVNVRKLAGVYSDPVSQVFVYPSGEATHFITLCFVCDLAGGLLQADHQEIRNAAFFDINLLPDDLLTMHPQWLSDALSNQDMAFIR